jgi:hypothetical protein
LETVFFRTFTHTNIQCLSQACVATLFQQGHTWFVVGAFRFLGRDL